MFFHFRINRFFELTNRVFSPLFISFGFRWINITFESHIHTCRCCAIHSDRFLSIEIRKKSKHWKLINIYRQNKLDENVCFIEHEQWSTDQLHVLLYFFLDTHENGHTHFISLLKLSCFFCIFDVRFYYQFGKYIFYCCLVAIVVGFDFCLLIFYICHC